MKRIRMEIAGIVQGVGFRPFVYLHAIRAGLTGFVYNHAAGVTVEAQGDPAAIDDFARAVEREPPPLSNIERCDTFALPAVEGESRFEIVESRAGGRTGGVTVSPDVSICADCLSEIENKGDRRFGHPFANCTHCGPRYSIIRSLPYDRPATAMADFPLCPACAAEYRDPADRRFHAQPVCCPACGPRLSLEELGEGRQGFHPCTPSGVIDPRTPISFAPLLRERGGEGRENKGSGAVGPGGGSGAEPPSLPDLPPSDPLDETARRLVAGQVVAIKGVGGFHLASTLGGEGLARLRGFKGRMHKPFAAMAADVAAVEAACAVTAGERALLEAAERPIVLLPMREGSPLSALSPGLSRAGVMLPYTPLHHLLMRRMKALGHPFLVMTSANLAGEPLCATDDEVRARLAGIAESLLTHDRPIVARIDDSVLLEDRGGSLFLRRARGFAPNAIRIARRRSENLLCIGGDLKNAFALVAGERAILSPHTGDLEHPETADHLLATCDHLMRLHDFTPDALVVDAHPGYHSARLAAERFAHLPCRKVFHHEAHAGAILAEHRAEPPAVALAFDGTGYGPDGTIWGGECFAVTAEGVRRAGRLRPLPLVSGDAAVKSPARAALGYLAALLPDEALLATGIARRFPEVARAALHAVRRNARAVPCSSAGRLFDVASCLAGVRDAVTYEAQAAMEFEALLDPSDAGDLPLPVRPVPGAPDLLEADSGELLLALLDQASRGTAAGSLSARFHRALARAAARMAERTAAAIGTRVVGLSGGCFLNRALLRLVRGELESLGLSVLAHRLVPPGDGGLCLGQAWVADRFMRAGD